jgi:acetate kinase
MGYTPLEGLVMATRRGSVDPGLLLEQLRRGLTVDAIDHALQQESGLLGLSELIADMRELRQAAAQGHQGAALAIEVFRQRLLEGIGEHDQALARELEEALAWLRPFELLQIPADEEGVIARQCVALRGATRPPGASS